MCRMSCWFLLSTALLLQSTNLMFQSSVVQASQHSWTGIHHHRTIIENHDNYNGVSDTSTYINYNRSLLRLLTLRAGDILSDDDDSSSNNSRRRRKRKRVRLDPPPLSTDVERVGNNATLMMTRWWCQNNYSLIQMKVQIQSL